jgi:hypothetical protein
MLWVLLDFLRYTLCEHLARTLTMFALFATALGGLRYVLKANNW